MTMTLKHVAGAAIIAAGLTANPARAAELPTIGGIVFQQDQYFRGIQLGLQAGAKDHATLLQGNSESKAEKEATLVDTFVARGAKAIVIAPISAKASVKALQRANDKGVKIVLYGTHMDADFPVAFIGTSDGDIGMGSGKIAAKFIKDKLGGKAKLGILAFRSQLAEQSDARTNGFLAAAKEGTTLDTVAQQDGFLAEKAVAVASDLLTAHPEINVIYAANEGGTVGAVQAVRRAGKQGKVFVFGTDGSEQLANFLLDPDGVLIATTAQQPAEVGKDAIETALQAIGGKTVEKQVLVPALPLSRDDKAGVEAFLTSAKAMQ
ncbi:substrate-binding domain-containing protein [Lichenifustis flavocetrariae]|uniref:Substrate-binding domain-containing protein n=1 Tax=Lichenifustis flavocetrariae TaxID=2949735 RepID=A0AA41Z6F3_9HYPH|nr:substrate-binding domain-containing protein [Lichenifustis flavocetrariae]MCW6511200.1 substrate-binding domain-containing protein [Lichenifustis flavocetrariae]